MDPSLRLFCFGLGYSAQVLARRLAAVGGAVCGSVRTRQKADALRRQGFDTVVFDDAEAVRAALAQAHLVLACVPPLPAGDPVLATYGPALLQARPRWLGYLSTTGVYGDCAGRWVDETAPLAPQSPRGRRRVEAEQAWRQQAAASGSRYAVFRLPGIYGPGRSAIDAVREGRARRIDKPGQVFSRIHVEDLATALMAALTKMAEGIYNVCDDEPAAQPDIIAAAAQRMGVPVPPLESYRDAAASMSPMARSFYDESKRVENTRMKRELGVSLRYPSWREGLADLA